MPRVNATLFFVSGSWFYYGQGDDGEIDYDGIDDYLSDKTGFCHFGYKLKK